MQNRNHVLWSFHCWHNPSPLTYTFSRERKIFLSSSPLSHWWRYFIFISQYTVACISVESPKSVYFDCRGWVSFQLCSLQLFSWTLLLLSRYVSHFQLLFFERKTTPQNPFRIQVRKKRKFEILCFFALSPAHFPGNQTECHLPFFSWDRHACRMETATQVCTAKRASRTETFGPDARVQGLWTLLQRSVRLFFLLIFFFVSLLLCLFDVILNLLWLIR